MNELDDLEYLAALTAVGLKPLSRWEKPLTSAQREALAARGLHVANVTRLTEEAGSVTHTIFSRNRSLVAAYQADFDRTPLTPIPATIRWEARYFGYPACCANAFALHGHQPNGLDPADQAILFHWACPGCEVTPWLLWSYRQIWTQVMNRRIQMDREGLVTLGQTLSKIFKLVHRGRQKEIIIEWQGRPLTATLRAYRGLYPCSICGEQFGMGAMRLASSAGDVWISFHAPHILIEHARNPYDPASKGWMPDPLDLYDSDPEEALRHLAAIIGMEFQEEKNG